MTTRLERASGKTLHLFPSHPFKGIAQKIQNFFAPSLLAVDSKEKTQLLLNRICSYKPKKVFDAEFRLHSSLMFRIRRVFAFYTGFKADFNPRNMAKTLKENFPGIQDPQTVSLLYSQPLEQLKKVREVFEILLIPHLRRFQELDRKTKKTKEEIFLQYTTEEIIEVLNKATQSINIALEHQRRFFNYNDSLAKKYLFLIK